MKGGICLKIAKILNNNVVISVDKNGEDIIVMGSGIAFQKKHGDLIDEKKVERILHTSGIWICGQQRGTAVPDDPY